MLRFPQRLGYNSKTELDPMSAVQMLTSSFPPMVPVEKDPCQSISKTHQYS